MIPFQNACPKPIRFNQTEESQISEELHRFETLGIIEKVDNIVEEGEFISNIFFRPKKEQKIRVILNLNKFNDFVQYHHFKMETINNALNAMSKNCWMGSVDLSEAYYSIPLCKQDWKWFRFWFKGQKYQFKVLVMGLASAPRVWTKIMKPVFAFLRKQGYISVSYIDDSYLQGTTFKECQENISKTVKLMDDLGLTVNTKKSVLIPTQKLKFVGFILCSVSMTVRLTQEKITNIKTLCFEILKKKFITIRTLAKLIGMLVASEPGVLYAQFYYKPLEKIKEKNLNWKKGRYDAFMKVTDTLRNSLSWWANNIDRTFKPIILPDPDLILFTDSSSFGWGAFLQTSNQSTSGLWSVDEQKLHINILELKACELSLLALCGNVHNVHIRIYTDNTTTCAYINKFGGRKNELNDIARNIWNWALEREIHISAAHIPGVCNVQADSLSRTFNDDLEWALSKETFMLIQKTFGNTDIDLFASRLNNQLPKYVSRFPDPAAFAVDAFSLIWNDYFYFIFPPFSLIPKILQKLKVDRGEAVLVAPIWYTQSFWPTLKQMTRDWIDLPAPSKILHLPHKPEEKHPITKMKLGAFRISGNS